MQAQGWSKLPDGVRPSGGGISQEGVTRTRRFIRATGVDGRGLDLPDTRVPTVEPPHPPPPPHGIPWAPLIDNHVRMPF